MVSFVQCNWIHRSVDHLLVKSERASAAQVNQLLARLPQLKRLRSFELTAGPFVIIDRLFREGVVALAATLQNLNVACNHNDASSFVPGLLSRVGVLKQLESFVVKAASIPAHLDLSVLPMLKRLHTFVLCSESGEIGPCNPAQVEALSRCKALTVLQCGQWIPARGAEMQSELSCSTSSKASAGCFDCARRTDLQHCAAWHSDPSRWCFLSAGACCRSAWDLNLCKRTSVAKSPRRIGCA